MAVTAVTITSDPTVVGRSVTVSGILDRDGSGTNNTLNFLSYTVGYVSVYTITRLSDSATFLNVAGTAETGVAWTWTGTLPEGNYLGVSISLNDAPYTTFVTSANVGLVELRRPLPGIWTPQRDSRGLFVPKADGVDSPISSTAGFISTRKFHYNYAVAGSNGIYTTVLNKILRRSDQNYGPVNLRSVNTPYGVGIDAQTGWQFNAYPVQGGGYSVLRQTWISLFYIYDAAKAITNYPRFFGGVGNNPAIRNQTISWNNPAGEQALVVTSDTGFGGSEVSINGVGNGLHCMVVTSVASTSAGSIRIFLDGQFVTTTTGPNGWNGGTFPNTDFFANSVSQSGENIGNILFNGILYNYVASDDEAQKLSLNPYSYFFRDAPKTSAKRRLFGGVLSLPATTTQFKGGRFLPQRWKSQPQAAARIDWGNGLTRNLQVVLHPVHGRFYDVTRYVTANSFANTSVVGSPAGMGLNGIDIISNGGISSQFSSFFPTAASYVVCGFSVDPYWHGISYVSHSLGGYGTGPNSSQFGVATDAYSLGRQVTFRLSTQNADGAGNTLAFPNLLEQGKPFIYGSTRVTGVNGLKAFSSGRFLGSADGGTGGIGPYSATVDAGNTTYYGSGNTILMVAYWDRALSDSEMISVTSEPWQIFKPKPGRIYFLPGATKRGKFLFLFS